MWLCSVTLWLFFRESVAKSPCRCGSGSGIYNLIQKLLSGESALIRDVVQMRIDGFSYYEIAAKHHISENSARVVYFRAKSKIKKHLEKEGFRYD